MKKPGIRAISVIVFALGLVFIPASSRQAATLETSKATISGLVMDAATKRPLPRVAVFLFNQGLIGPIRETVSQTSALDGSFQFLNLDPDPDSLGSYSVSACDSNYHCSSIIISGLLVGQNKQIEMAMEKNITLFVHAESVVNPTAPLDGAHISIITPKRESDLPQWWTRTVVFLSDSTGLSESPDKGKAINASLGETVQICVSKEGFNTQIVSKTLSLNSWEDTLTVLLVPDTAGSFQTLQGSVVDQYGSSDGLAVMFLGVVEGKPFVQFEYAKGNKFKIEGISDTISGGELYVLGDSFNVVKADFSRNLSLTSHSPVTTVIRASRYEQEKVGKIGLRASKIGSGKSERRLTNLLGQNFSKINLGINNAGQPKAPGIILIPE
jgi:hypothetical protein